MTATPYPIPPWQPHSLCREEIRGGHEPGASTASPPKIAPDQARTETYARAICRVYVEDSARIMRIKVTEAWIAHRVNSRWAEYVGQAVAAMALADAELRNVEQQHECDFMRWQAEMEAKQADYERIGDAYNATFADLTAAESREADLRRERNALVLAMAGTVVGSGDAGPVALAPTVDAA